MKWFDKIEKVVINIWSFLWMLTITAVSVGVALKCIKWIAELLEVL